MAGISGFPTNIDVTLGAAWAGRFGMDPSDVVSLTNVDADDWSEDGTLTINTTTNRLALRFSHATTQDFVDIKIINGGTAFFTVEVQVNLTTGQANNGTQYTFLDIFSDTQTNVNVNHNFTPGYMNNFLSVQTDYNPSFFSAIEAGAAPSIDPTGIATAEAFGTTNVGYALQSTGITSEEAFPNVFPDQHFVDDGIHKFPVGIVSAEAFGTLNLDREILPTGITSLEASGTPNVGTQIPAFILVPRIGRNPVGLFMPSVPPTIDEFDWQDPINRESPLAQGLTGLWWSGASYGSDVLFDLTGRFDGSAISDPVITYDNKAGFGISTDATADYLAIPDDARLRTSDLSVMLWTVKSGSATQGIVNTHLQSGDTGWILGMVDSDLTSKAVWQAGAASTWPTYDAQSSAEISDGLHQIIGIHDGSNHRLYVDGVEDGSDSTSGAINHRSHDIWIGRDADDSSFKSGEIYFLALWDRVLTVEEIQRSYDTEFRWELLGRIPELLLSGVQAGIEGISSEEAFGTAHLVRTVVVNSITSVEAFGTADLTQSEWTYRATGQITLGTNIFNDIDLLVTYFIEQDFGWNVKSQIIIDQDFEWNVSTSTLFWYRIEGECIEPTCKFGTVDTDQTGCGSPPTQGQTFTQLVAARNLTDLCKKLKRKFITYPMKWPIKFIHRYSRPVRLNDIRADEAKGIDHTCNRLIKQKFSQVPECLDFVVSQQVQVDIGVVISIQDSFLGYIGSGTILIGGVAGEVSYNYEGSGGMVLAGEADAVSTTWEDEGSGGIVLAGEASDITSSAWQYSGTGSIVASGEAVLVSPSWTTSSSGGLILSGNADTTLCLSYEPLFPLITLGGSADAVAA